MPNAPLRVRATQLIVAEVVVVGLLGAARGPGWFFAGVLVVAVGLLLGTFGRVDGRWWYEAAFGYRRFARRRRRAAAGLVAATIGADPVPSGLAWLRTITPDLRIRSVGGSGAGGPRVGVGSDEHGWFAVVEVSASPSERRRGPANSGLPLAELAELVGSGADRPGLSSAQAVLRPDGQLGWLAVRLSAVDAVDLERAHGPAAVDAAVGSGVQRAARTLRAAGYAAAVLDPAGLLGALLESAGLDGPPQEHWAYWRSGRQLHAVFLAWDWPARLPLADAGLGVSISVSAPGAWGVLIRVSARPGHLGPGCRRLIRAAALAGVRLQRLDGEHAPAAYACSPTGRPAEALLHPVAVGRFPGRLGASLGSTSSRSAADPYAPPPGSSPAQQAEPSESRGWGT
jgi:hypothetical protein